MNFPLFASQDARVPLRAATLLLCTLPCSAQNSTTLETGSIERPPSLPAGYVVMDMDVSGNTMVLSAVTIGTNLTVPPYVETHVFVNGEWTFESRIEDPSPPLGASSSAFGRSVAIDGNQLVIGESSPQSFGGLALVYNRVGGVWTLSQEIIPPPGSSGGIFQSGQVVAIAGGTIMVGGGGFRTDPTMSPRYAVRVYEETSSGYLLSQTLLESTTPPLPRRQGMA